MVSSNNRTSYSFMLAVITALIAVCPLVGLVLVYSDLSGQRPIHNQATVGLLLLWVPIVYVVIVLMALLDRGHDDG